MYFSQLLWHSLIILEISSLKLNYKNFNFIGRFDCLNMTDQLVETIVRQDFGVKFADVTNILLKNPNVTLLELKSLCKEANISFDMLRHILIILYKHNLVTIRSKSTDSGTADQNGDKDKIYYYSLSIPDIIHRTRLNC